MENRKLERDKAENEAALTCDEVCELLYLFISDELDENESRSVSAHLFGCATCRKAMAETVKVAGTLSTVLPRVPQRYYSRYN